MNKAVNVRDIIKNNIKNKKNKSEKIMPNVFLLSASISILTTIGIVMTLIFDSYKFFSKVPLKEVFSTRLAPLSANPSFGILPLINGTIITSLIAMCVAVPVGLTAAMYLSEFASEKRRNTFVKKEDTIETLLAIHCFPHLLYRGSHGEKAHSKLEEETFTER